MISRVHTGKEVRSVDFNFDGSLLAAGTKDGEVMIYKCDAAYSTITLIDTNRQRNACINDVK